MNQSVKRIAIVVSIVLNAGFILAVGWIWVRELNEQEPQDIVSQHYEFYHKLDLSVEQDRTIDSLLAAYLDKQAALRAQVIHLEQQLKDAALFTDEDSSRIATLTSQIAGLRGEQEMITARHLRQVRGVLTPPQTKKMNAMLEKFFSQQNNQSK